jgi:hypothetical protein
MSQVEVVRRAFAVPEFFDPNVRVVWLDPLAAGKRETEGLDGLSQGIKGWVTSFDNVTTDAERIIDAGDQVAVIAAWHGRGKTSGVDVEWRYGAVWTLRNGKVISLVSYSDPADALKAVGLEE